MDDFYVVTDVLYTKRVSTPRGKITWHVAVISRGEETGQEVKMNLVFPSKSSASMCEVGYRYKR